MAGRLSGKRILITQCNDYMGPAAAERMRAEGAEVIADASDLREADAAERVVGAAGAIDVLVANLAAPANLGVAASEMPDEIWHEMFDVMVHPLHRLCRAVLPAMYERKRGKVLVYGSATGLRGLAGVSAYSAARSAQVGYVRTVGLEAAPHNVQVNLIAQNWTENPAYFPPAFTETDAFNALLEQHVPMGRLGKPHESAALAVFLASDDADFFAGQSFPFSGGWNQ